MNINLIAENARKMEWFKSPNNYPLLLSKDFFVNLRGKDQEEIKDFLIKKYSAFYDNLHQFVFENSWDTRLLSVLETLSDRNRTQTHFLTFYFAIYIEDFIISDDEKIKKRLADDAIINNTKQQILRNGSDNSFWTLFVRDSLVPGEERLIDMRNNINPHYKPFMSVFEEVSSYIRQSLQLLKEEFESGEKQKIETQNDSPAAQLTVKNHVIVLLHELGIVDSLKEKYNISTLNLAELLSVITGIKIETIRKGISPGNYKSGNSNSDVYTENAIQEVNKILIGVKIEPLKYVRVNKKNK